MAVAFVALASVATMTAFAPPVQAAGNPTDPFFGTWSDGLSMTPAESQATLDKQQSAGVGLIRQYIWWNRMETSPGVYDWRRMDQLVTDASARGIQILPTLLYTPDFYSSKPQGSTSTSQFPPANPQNLADFATAMVKRYGPGGSFWCKPSPIPTLPPDCRTPNLPIHYWEIWNE